MVWWVGRYPLSELIEEEQWMEEREEDNLQERERMDVDWRQLQCSGSCSPVLGEVRLLRALRTGPYGFAESKLCHTAATP